MSAVADRLQEQRNRQWHEAREIIEGASQERRDLTAEENGRWSRIMEAMDDTDKQLEGVLTAEKRQADTDAAFDAIGRKPVSLPAGLRSVAPADRDGRDVNSEIRAMIRGEQGAPRSLDFRHNGPFGESEFRTLVSNSGSPTAIVPTDFYDRLIAYLIEVSGVLQAGPTVLNTSGGETLLIPQATAHSAAASASQGNTIPSSDPTFSQTSLSAYKYGILLQVARELIDDTAVDLLGYLAMQAGRAVGNKFGSDLVTAAGGGSAPKGLIACTSASPAVTGAFSSATSAFGGVVGSPSYANLLDMEYSVIAPYRQSRSCYWICADKTVAVLRKITDSTGRPIWEPSTVLGSPDLLLGKPLVADPYMPQVGANAFSLAFGDFAQFFVRLVGGVRFERSDDFQFGSDLVAFRCLIRGDGTLLDNTAVKLFKGGAS